MGAWAASNLIHHQVALGQSHTVPAAPPLTAGKYLVRALYTRGVQNWPKWANLGPYLRLLLAHKESRKPLQTHGLS